MDEPEFKRRTRALGTSCIQLCRALPREPTVSRVVQQLVRSATSVGANYRASCRGRSVAEIIAKLTTVEEEADETAYWLEVLVEAGILPESAVIELHNEANEIVAMEVASKRTLTAKVGARGFAASTSIVNRES